VRELSRAIMTQLSSFLNSKLRSDRSLKVKIHREVLTLSKVL